VIAYLVLGLLVTAWSRGSRRPRVVLVAATVVVAVVTVLDVASMSAPFDRTVAAQEADELRAYGGSLDAALPAGCGVLTVPAYLFPEGLPGDGTITYDPLLPYLFAQNPRWSYGGVRGSQAGAWQYESMARDVPTMVAQAKAAGFCAVQVDTRAFASAASPVGSLTALLGAPVAQSTSGRWVTFSLDGADAGSWTRDYALDPARAVFGFGFAPQDVTASTISADLVGTDGALAVANPRSTAVSGDLVVDVAIESAAAQPAPSAVGRCPVDSVVTVSTIAGKATAPDGGTASIPVTVEPDGIAAAHVHAPAGCRVTLSNPRLVPVG